MYLIIEDEEKEIELHKYYLSEKHGYDVGWDHAYNDWKEKHSQKWRRHRMKKDAEDEIQEILAHKWIESEKAMCDLGDKAVFDWIEKYAAKWRKHRKPRKM